MMQNQQMMQLNVDRLNYLKDARANAANSGSTDYQSQLDLQTALDEINLNYQFNQMNLESVFQAQEDSMLQEVNRQQQQLELEQEQIGTFLMYLDHLISSQRSKIDEYERLKAGLLQQLFI